MPGVRVRGLKELRRDLKAIDKAFGPALRKVYLQVANLVEARAVAAAPARAKRAIKGRATQRNARIELGGGRRGDELAVLLGATRRFGWYSARRYRTSSARQFPQHVGQAWDPFESPAAPYHIGPAIHGSVDAIVDLFAEGVDEVARQAFPES